MWLCVRFDGLCLCVCVCVCVALCVEPMLEVEGEREEKKRLLESLGKPKVSV